MQRMIKCKLRLMCDTFTTIKRILGAVLSLQISEQKFKIFHKQIKMKTSWIGHSVAVCVGNICVQGWARIFILGGLAYRNNVKILANSRRGFANFSILREVFGSKAFRPSLVWTYGSQRAEEPPKRGSLEMDITLNWSEKLNQFCERMAKVLMNGWLVECQTQRSIHIQMSVKWVLKEFI